MFSILGNQWLLNVAAAFVAAIVWAATLLKANRV